MEKFTVLKGIAAPLLRRNIDTDAIIPGKELRNVEKGGLGDGLFGQWRYLDGDRKENPDFVLNRPPYRDAVILLADENFGCGSSREGAVWALTGFGIRCVIAPSFAAIFYNSSFKNGLLPVVLSQKAVYAIAGNVEQHGGTEPVTVDLVNCRVTDPGGQEYGFKLNRLYRQMLLEGLDQIDATLRLRDEIVSFQERDRVSRPWVYEYQTEDRITIS